MKCLPRLISPRRCRPSAARPSACGRRCSTGKPGWRDRCTRRARGRSGPPAPRSFPSAARSRQYSTSSRPRISKRSASAACRPRARGCDSFSCFRSSGIVRPPGRPMIAVAMPWPLSLRFSSFDVQPHRVALGGLGASQLRAQADRAAFRAGRLQAADTTSSPCRGTRSCRVISSRSLLMPGLEHLLGVGQRRASAFPPRRPGTSCSRSACRRAAGSVHPPPASFVGPGVGDHGLQGQDGRLRRAEAAVAATLLADPRDRLVQRLLELGRDCSP